jgi:serine/threonine protein kinase
MTYLHSRSFIHRDLKSLNLLLTKEISGPTDEIQVKISDFGLSKHYIEGDMMTGQQGTCHWMAPEVLESSNYTLKADVYSFSIVMYEVLTRERPYKDKQPNEISIQVIRQKLRPDLSKISKGCNPALQSLMQLCWDSDSQRRPSFEKISKILETIK